MEGLTHRSVSVKQLGAFQLNNTMGVPPMAKITDEGEVIIQCVNCDDNLDIVDRRGIYRCLHDDAPQSNRWGDSEAIWPDEANENFPDWCPLRDAQTEQ